jgi:sterol desaturase/sphingolipid hydroxylase (fatty acid hydroxylase superfamily)
MRALAPRLLPGTIFPLTLAAAIAGFFCLMRSGVPLVAATYLSVSIAIVSVFACERLIPYRAQWRAPRSEQGQDFLFLSLVHVLFTKFLGVAAAFVVAAWLRRFIDPVAFWPRHWPLIFQGLLMVLSVDFFRYWLHRACHSVPSLWALHAVHHSPRRLYWLNVGRFHPLERFLQFLLDSLPFLIIGVGMDVLALYYVFFAVNGFFQHCNVSLRYGPLNWIFSTAELHRWHHSKLPRESDSNFSNTTIIWDIVFGTRFLPKDRSVGELGLRNDSYPTGFLAQMKTPFLGGIENRPLPLLSFRDILLNALLRCRMVFPRLGVIRSLGKAAENPGTSQQKVLLRILRDNRDTDFGKLHGFASIRGEADFRERVPVSTYEELRPFIEEQARTGRPVLTREAPVLYQQTSGSTGAPKYIPLIPSALSRIQRLQGAFSALQYRFRPEAFHGKLLGIVSPAVEGRLSSGVPFGSASGLIYRNIPRLARAKFVLPYEVFEIEDYPIRYSLMLRLALAERDITSMGSANPSTFLKLLDLMAEDSAAFVADIRSGTARHLDRIEPRIAKAVVARLRPDPARAAELESALARPSGPDFGSVWPHLKLVTTWTGGSCGMAAAKLKSKLPPDAVVYELGYLSSEFRGTVTVDPLSGAGLPTLDDHYFEFVEKSAWENGRPVFRSLAEVEPGDYYLFVTTPSGLYRYAMNDIVRMSGRFAGSPTLRFLQKGRGVANITGEKVYESQVLEAVAASCGEIGISARFFLMAADEEDFRYRLYLEAEIRSPAETESLAAGADAALQNLNLEYRSKRAGNRLKPMEVRLLMPGAGEGFKLHFLAKGHREAQFKPMALQYLKDLDMDLEAWRCRP